MRPARVLVGRAALALAASSAIAAYARAYDAPSAYVLVVPCLASVRVRLRAVPAIVASPLRAAVTAAVVLAATIGWVSMLHSAPAGGAERQVTEIVGATLATAIALLSLATRSFPPGRALLPSVVALLALAGFERNSALDAFGAAAAAFVFVHLLADAGADVVAPRAVPLRPARAIALVLFAATAAAIGIGVTRILPLAQGRLERALLATDLPAFDGGSGLADGDVRLGDVGELELHDDVVLRVFSPRAEKLRAHAYLRFDGRTWHVSGPRRVARRVDARALGGGLAARLEDPSGELYAVGGGVASSADLLVTRVVLAEGRDGGLPAPAHARLLRIDTPLVEVDPAGMVSIGAGSHVWAYSVAHARGQREPETLDDDARDDALEVPADLDPRLKQLARSIARGAHTTEAKISRTVDAVRARARYSLDPGAFHGRQPVAEFLFEKHRGWCEYFASATALLLRLEGVPTRYVTGFDVHEDDRAGDHFVVRSADAHAWVEAWIDDDAGGGRWVEIDPTPSAALDPRRRPPSALAAIREWIEGVIARAELAPSRALARTGAAAAFALTTILLARWMRRRRARARAIVALPSEPPALDLPSPAVRALAAVEAEFQAHGVPRPLGRTLREHFGAVATTLPDDVRARAARRISLVYRAAYAGEEVDEAARPSIDVSSRA